METVPLDEIYFIKFEEMLFYYNPEIASQWLRLHKDEDSLTIADIIKWGMGNRSPYLTPEYLQKLGDLGISGQIEYLMGTHSIEELKRATFLNHEVQLELNTAYRYNLIEHPGGKVIEDGNL
jgi:hypothetical protein